MLQLRQSCKAAFAHSMASATCSAVTCGTLPMIAPFIHGELIGGCDITMELYESGELARMIAETQKA